MRRLFTWPLPLAAVWFLTPLLGAVVAATIEPLPPHDYWWHLAMGRLIAATGSVPSQNIFLYTLDAARPFVDQPWLGQWMMWHAFDLFGHAGGIWLRNLLLLASVTLLAVTALHRSGEGRAVGALMFAMVMLAYPVLTVRTQMFAFLPFAAVLWCALGVAEGRLRPAWLLLIPITTAFWANVHGSFVLGPAIVGAVGVGLVGEQLLASRRVALADAVRWAGVIAATLLAPMLTPEGYGVYSYVVTLAVTSTVATSVTEWLPPDPLEASGALFLACVVGTLIVLAIRRRSVRLYEVLLFAGTLYLSASAMRNLFWWAAVMPVVVAPHFAALLPLPDDEKTVEETAPSTRSGIAYAGFLAMCLLLAVALQPGVARDVFGEAAASGTARRSGEGAHLLNHEHAVVLVDKIRSDKRGRVFHDQALGGMLEFELTTAAQPAPVAFVDQRMEFVPESVWDTYFEVSRAVSWREHLARFRVDTLLLNHEAQWPLLQAALASGDWELTGVDQAHVLFYRRASLDSTEDPAKEQ